MTNPFDPGYYESDELRAMGFGAVGENVRISKTCNIPRFDNIEVGDNVRIDAFTSIIAMSGYLKLGSYIHICIGCMIGCRGGVEMEDFAGLSHGSTILSATDDFGGHYLTNSLVPEEYTKVEAAPVRLGRHVAIGAGAVILPGITIGEGCGVGSMSLVTKSLDPWGIYAGVPARRIKDRTRGLLALEVEMLGSLEVV